MKFIIAWLLGNFLIALGSSLFVQGLKVLWDLMDGKLPKGW
jgi:hypothetical protein